MQRRGHHALSERGSIYGHSRPSSGGSDDLVIVVANDPTIFHFNCPFCGAHPSPVRLTEFLDRWRSSPESDLDALIGLYARILCKIKGSPSRWKTKKFASAVERVLQWVRKMDVVSNADLALDVERQGRSMAIDCPLCLTPKGPRPPDRYFGAWANADKVQVANLLYETEIVLFAVARALPRWASARLLGQLGHLLVMNHKALIALGLFECPYCGRHTTCLYGEGSTANPHRCRWCLDRSGVFGVRFSCEITEEGIRVNIGMDDLIPAQLDDDLIPFLRAASNEPS